MHCPVCKSGRQTFLIRNDPHSSYQSFEEPFKGTEL